MLRLALLLAAGLAGTFAVLVSVQRYVVELTDQRSKWAARLALATIAVLACLGALPFALPSSYLSVSADRVLSCPPFFVFQGSMVSIDT